MADKLLFTPGPLTTSKTVKEAMLRDLGSRDSEFIEKVNFIRNELLAVAGVSKEKGYESILIQGSGTFGIESVISSSIPKTGHLLILVNGVYGDRIAKMAAIHAIPHTCLVFAEDQTPDLELLRQTLSENSAISHVATIHCETTTGIINPIQEIGAICKSFGKTYIVDAMSSFGAYFIDFEACLIDYLISSSNKCIEGVPGFSFVIAKKETLLSCENQARSLSLDLFAQWKGLEKDGQFRFTPPTHSLLAFAQALVELQQEGGVLGRAARYKNNYTILSEGMKKLGFKEYLEDGKRGYIITCFHYPTHPNFNFKDFYSALSEKGFVIYPGKLSKVDCFRIGNIGRINDLDIQNLLFSIQETLSSKEIHLV
jgi:2-aminoethylphosphonate-pyruvate transaminase